MTAARSKKLRPFIAVNFAMTWDGKITTRNLSPANFSSKNDKRRLLEIRATGDALLVGKTTLAKDNMKMALPAEDLRAARIAKGMREYPMRVILSNSGRIDPALRTFQFDFSPIVIYSTAKMPRKNRDELSKLAELNLADGEAVDLHAMFTDLRQRHKIKRLICEGGAGVFRSLLAEDLVDEINLTLCPRLFGGDKAPTLTGLPGDFLPRSLKCRLASMETVGDECYLKYLVKC